MSKQRERVVDIIEVSPTLNSFVENKRSAAK